jgi:hypothetical protein
MRYSADPSGIPTASPAHHRRQIPLRTAMAAITFHATHPNSSEGRDTVAAADTHLAMIKRFYLEAFAILLAGGGAVGLIALRAAIFVWRFH